ncbi:MAG: YihY/virulence factor BrkB family protein [Actinobacteria bacterium]|nr:YihY/virulence factor BrkB family protein [Actinomycetota bacterium]
MRAGPARDLLAGLVARFREADLGINAAAVAYNAFLAMVPLGLALLGAASFIGESDAALARVDSTLAPLVPGPVREFIIQVLVDAEARLGGMQWWVIALSVLLALFLGSRAIAALQKALAAVENRTDRRPLVQMRLVAVGLTIGGGAVLLLASALLLAGKALVGFLEELTGAGWLDVLWAWVRLPIVAGGLFAFLLAFYRWGPPEPLPKPWLAAAVGTGGVLLASLAFGLYLGATPVLGATFGVLGAVALALVWLYLGAAAILAGAMVVAYTLRWRASRNGEASA